MRERSTRRSLGLDDESGSGDKGVPTHASKWLLFLAPCAVLWFVGDNPPGALAKAELLVRSTPNSSVAQFKLGEALNEAGRHLDSLPVLERSLGILPDDEEARLHLALAQLEAGKDLWRQGKRKEAERLLQAAYLRRPEVATNDSNDRGLRLWKEGQLQEAILHFQVALVMNPDMAIAHLNLALVYRDASQLRLALQHAKKGAALRPGDPAVQQLVRSLQGR